MFMHQSKAKPDKIHPDRSATAPEHRPTQAHLCYRHAWRACACLSRQLPNSAQPLPQQALHKLDMPGTHALAERGYSVWPPPWCDVQWHSRRSSTLSLIASCCASPTGGAALQRAAAPVVGCPVTLSTAGRCAALSGTVPYSVRPPPW